MARKDISESSERESTDESGTPSLTSGRAKGATLIPSIEGGGAGFGDQSPESVREDLTEWISNIHRLAQEFADARVGEPEEA